MMDLRTKYQKEVIPGLKEKFGFKNNLAVPKLLKITLNVGLSRAISEKDGRYAEIVKDTLNKISGQKPIEIAARKSISGFKIREGLLVGMKVTLRGGRMYDFVDKLVNIVLPRTRDFCGISAKGIDKSGNLSLGLREHLVFPEIKTEDVQKIHGLQITITSNAKNREQGLELFKLLGFPFKLD
ncbi:MAG: 50S ribosomal protein L5 [Patescibacteria group bacterium]|nr:50S ribosomal protein L5 [Patescibacteria group bacterium]MDD5121043.1 50S ribosomal protein L5 [Patescibacteria group bacterium]MDD5221595.1 50S ribosomal protein L5 [Patescibacteria group bacterium]MDD5396038.1 50S ribosomal protein L5 [Patescibacteria group bacterium]